MAICCIRPTPQVTERDAAGKRLAELLKPRGWGLPYRPAFSETGAERTIGLVWRTTSPREHEFCLLAQLLVRT